MAPKTIIIDVEEFTRSRDAFTTSLLVLSSTIDKSVKAYIEHTNAVIAGEATLDTSIITAPFSSLQALGSTARTASAAGVKVVDDDVEDEGKKKKKRAYKPRDPDAPKRPLTAYFRFLGEMRPLLAIELAKTGKHAPGELSRVATERWHAMSQEKKLPYHNAYEAAKLNYEKEVAAYKATTGQAVINEMDVLDEDPQLDVSTTTTEDEDEEETPAPPPPKAKKSASPEAVKKTPKASQAPVSTPAAGEKTPKSATTTKKKAAATPMFNSINVEKPATGKKRKAEAAPPASPTADAESPPKKKKVGRPSLSAEEKERRAAEKKKSKKTKETVDDDA